MIRKALVCPEERMCDFFNSEPMAELSIFCCLGANVPCSYHQIQVVLIYNVPVDDHILNGHKWTLMEISRIQKNLYKVICKVSINYYY